MEALRVNVTANAFDRTISSMPNAQQAVSLSTASASSFKQDNLSLSSNPVNNQQNNSFYANLPLDWNFNPPGGTGENPGGENGFPEMGLEQISGLVGSTVGGTLGTLKTMHIPKTVGQELQLGLGRAPEIEATPSKPSKFRNVGIAGKAIGKATIGGMGYSALFGGSVSALSNGYQVYKGEKDASQAIGSVAADTMTAAVAGGAAALVGGTAALGLGMLPIRGLTTTIASTGLGIAGAVGAHLLIHNSGIYDTVKNAATDLAAKYTSN